MRDALLGTTTMCGLLILFLVNSPDKMLLLKLEYKQIQRDTGNYIGVQKISTEDPERNLKTQSSPSSSSSRSRHSGDGLRRRLRGASHLETEHKREPTAGCGLLIYLSLYLRCVMASRNLV
jgi:hypothetical protein